MVGVLGFGLTGGKGDLCDVFLGTADVKFVLDLGANEQQPQGSKDAAQADHHEEQ